MEKEGERVSDEIAKMFLGAESGVAIREREETKVANDEGLELELDERKKRLT